LGLEGGTCGILLLSDQHQALAASRVGFGDDRRSKVGPQFGCQRLDRGEGDHLAADLGKALGAPFDRHKAVAVD
jgi:hypothetical protein